MADGKVFTMAVNEIKNGSFVYHNTFFADPGGDKRHTRASVAELKDLLLPKKGSAPTKDQVAHWYEAQLLHYGLPRTKDKNTAKVRLTSAITTGSLAVPPSIVQLEADMKKQFAAANRKIKTATKANEANSLQEPTSKSRKRKADFDDDSALSATTKISVKVGNIASDIDHQGGSLHSKKQKATPIAAKAKVIKNPTKSETKSSKVSKQPMTTGKLSKNIAATKAVQPPASSADTPRPKQTAKRTGGAPSSHVPQQQPAKKNNTSRAVRNSSSTPAARTNMHRPLDSHYQHDPDIEMYDAPPPYEAFESSDNTYREVTPIQVSGIYTISTPFDDMHCELTLVKDTRTDQFWGHFVAADQRGVMHIPRSERLATQEVVEFNWRASDEGSGQLRFKRDQNGWIQLDGQGSVRGCWNGLLYGEDIDFTGGLDGAPDIEVDHLIDQWEWFVKSAYGR